MMRFDRALPLFALLLFSATLAVSPTPATAALSTKDSACRNYISSKVAKLADTIIREQEKCNQKRGQGSLDPSVDCNDPDSASFPGASAVAKAASTLTDKVDAKCSAASTPAANGYTSCPSPCDATVPSIASYGNVAACLVCVAKAQAKTVMQVAYGTDPAIQGARDDAWKCQNSDVGAAMRTYIKKFMGEQRKCQYKEDKGKIDSTDCETADLKGSIAKALSKLQASIARCTDGDLAALTSCATTVSAEQSCIQSGADAMVNTLFSAIYPSGGTSSTSTTATCPSANFLDVSNAPGAGAGYPAPTLSVSCTSNTVTVQSNGIPPYTYVNVTPNGLQAKNYAFKFPLSPQIAAQTTDVPLLGEAGVAVDGLPVYGPNEAQMPDPYGDPVVNAILDECTGHTAQFGTYHYHALLVKCLSPSGLVSEPWLNPDPPTNQPSPIVAYAFDGFPIYGPYGCTDASCSSVVEYLSGWDNIGYQAGTVGCTSSASCANGYACSLVMINGQKQTACAPTTYAWQNNQYSAKAGTQYLDQCNGHVGPNGDYHYHSTATFPYIIGCFRGTPTANGGGNGP